MITFPQTIYAVALYYGRERWFTRKARVISWMFCITGTNPLTEQEAITRARAACEVQKEDLKNWRFMLGSVSWVGQEISRP